MSKGLAVKNKGLRIEKSNLNKKSIENAIYRKRIEIYQDNLLHTAIPAAILCSTIILWGLYGTGPTLFLGIWYGAAIATQIIRVLACWALKNNAFRFHIHLTLACLSALIWSVAGTVLMSQSDTIGQMIIIVVIAGITAGCTQTMQSSWKACAVFILLALTPLVAWIFIKGGEDYVPLGVALLVYIVFMLALSKRGYRILTNELALRYQKAELAKDLYSTNNDLAALNASLQESNDRFRLSFNNAAIGMALVSLEGRWLKVNQSLCELTGYSEQELLNIDFQTITHPEDLELDLIHVKQLIDGEINNYKMEKRYIHKDKSVFWILLNVSIVRAVDGKPMYFISQIQSIDTEKATEMKLKIMAYHDPLTGLINRAMLETLFRHAMADARRYHRGLAIFFIDIDFFKTINDTKGHTVGDELLKQFSHRLLSSVRANDIVSRIGGDEFILVITDVLNPEVVNKIAKKIQALSASPIVVDDEEVEFTISMGISLYPENGAGIEQLIKNADLALYNAKQSGRNTYSFF